MPENIKSKINGFGDIYMDDDNEAFEASKTEEAANMIIEAAKMTGNEITYSEINAMIADSNFDKDALEEIYDIVESKNVSIIETREPNASELEDDDVDDDEILELELEEDDLLNDEEDEKKSGVIIKSSGEIEVSDSAKNIPTDDPVRMYFKEIGKVPLLTAYEERELAIRIEQGDEEAEFRKQLGNIQTGPDDEAFYRETKAGYLAGKYRDEKAEVTNSIAVAEKMGRTDEIERLVTRLMELDSLINNTMEDSNA